MIDETKMKELKLDEKFTRIDGKKLTKKQKEKVRIKPEIAVRNILTLFMQSLRFA